VMTGRVMYRVLSSGLACVATLAAVMPANSTSIVTLAAIDPADTPSIVTVGDAHASLIEARWTDGAPAAGQNIGDNQLLVLSGSILASGPDAIPVAPEQVASVDNETERPTPRWI